MNANENFRGTIMLTSSEIGLVGNGGGGAEVGGNTDTFEDLGEGQE
jgi:hypothetical protein